MISVVCAIIVDGGRVLCVQRSEKMKLPGKWEFPGGKIEPGETGQAAIIREIQEELAIDIEPYNELTPSVYAYHHAHIKLIPYVCRFKGGAIRLHEHKAAHLLLSNEMEKLDWAEADKPIVAEVIARWEEIVS